jgi:hypothetical protein
MVNMMFKKLGMIGGALAILAVGAATAADWSLVQEDMRFMREEEKLARDVYATLYDYHLDQGLTLTVCDNIASSEQRHMEAMKQLLDNYSMADSAVDGGQGTYPESCLGDACKFNNTDLADLYVKLVADGKVTGVGALLVGGLIEEVDMIDLAEAIANAEDYADIQGVYDNLLCGSGNHLRAFAHNIELATGDSYIDASADYVDDFGIRPDAGTEAYDAYVASLTAILEAPMEHCGSGAARAPNSPGLVAPGRRFRGGR